MRNSLSFSLFALALAPAEGSCGQDSRESRDSKDSTRLELAKLCSALGSDGPERLAHCARPVRSATRDIVLFSSIRSSTRSAHLLRCHHPSSPFASLPSYTLPDRALCASLPRFRIVPARIVTSPRASLVRAHHTLLHTRSALVADHPPVW